MDPEEALFAARLESLADIAALESKR